MTPDEIRSIIDLLTRGVRPDLETLWRAAERSRSFRRYVVDAFPDLVLPRAAAAADAGVEMYESTPTTTRGFVAVEGDLAPTERLATSAQWALTVGNQATALSLLTGVAERAVMDGFRETIMTNVDREPGARWARHASANACGFCRMVATRHVGPNASFYGSEAAAGRVVGRGQEMSAADRRDRAAGRTRSSQSGRGGQYIAGGRRPRGSQEVGDKYHDSCRCVPIAIRRGQSWEPPPYVEQWNDDYIAATRLASSEGLPRDAKTIARLMETV